MATDTMPRTPRTVPGRGPDPKTPRTGKVAAPRHTRPALIAALESGHLGAAILDVTREEPLPADDPLWSAPNIYISPHCSAAQDRYTDTLLALFADNLERYTSGEPLRNIVDRVAGY